MSDLVWHFLLHSGSFSPLLPDIKHCQRKESCFSCSVRLVPEHLILCMVRWRWTENKLPFTMMPLETESSRTSGHCHFPPPCHLFCSLCSHVFQNPAFTMCVCAPECSLSLFAYLTSLISLTAVKSSAREFQPPWHRYPLGEKHMNTRNITPFRTAWPSTPLLHLFLVGCTKLWDRSQLHHACTLFSPNLQYYVNFSTPCCGFKSLGHFHLLCNLN